MKEPWRSAFELNECAPALARRWLVEGCDLDLQPGDPIVILLSELVTNSVLHGGRGADGRVEVTVGRVDRAVRVEVSDPGHGFSLPEVLPEHHGLKIVQELADRWGISNAPTTTVWFEVHLDGR